jgi:hypothetical protein
MGRKRVGITHGRAGVIVHDPDAQKAKNLDDPFHDPMAQERAAELIARGPLSGAKSD